MELLVPLEIGLGSNPGFVVAQRAEEVRQVFEMPLDDARYTADDVRHVRVGVLQRDCVACLSTDIPFSGFNGTPKRMQPFLGPYCGTSCFNAFATAP